MEIVWDEYKRKANILKHGYDFADFNLEMLETAYIVASHSNRFKAVIHLDEKTAVVVFIFLGTEALSLISMRPARKDERRLIL